MIVVTGASGFIGSCIVAKLNERNQNDLILVDEVSGDQSLNLRNKKYAKYYNKNQFLETILKDTLEKNIECIIHMGACSSTTLQDAEYFKKNNFEYTQHLAQWALKHNVRFIYASSAATYGDGSIGYKDDDETVRRCKPLNLYGESKQNFDQWALDNNLLDKMVGLKFFNVFGPNEYHKDDMRSVVAKAYKKVVDKGKISLFKSYNAEYKDGEQKRDFIYVKDAVNVVMFFVDHPNIYGIFNVGTGEACTWNDLASALFKAVKKPLYVDYIEMPDSLQKRYQYFTQADMNKLKNCGYDTPFTSLENAVADYAAYLQDEKYL